MTNPSGNSLLHKAFISAMILLTAWLFSSCTALPTPEPLPPTATPTQTETPTPTIDWFPDTPTPTFLPPATATPVPTREGLLGGITELLVEDDFSDPGLWLTPQNQSGNVAFGVQNLSLAVARPSALLISMSQHTLPEDFYLEISLQTSLCEGEDQIGIIFWEQSASDFYRLLVNCAGQYRLELVQGGSNFVIQDWETASQMQRAAPATNRLALWVYNGTLQFFINDAFQFEAGIAQDQSGDLGVFARTISGSTMTVRFSDLKIYRVELN